MWKIGYPIDGVWFNISSAKADGKYLTVTKIGNLKELTMEKGGTVCIANYMLYQLLSTFTITHLTFLLLVE